MPENLSRLEKIRRENNRFAKATPYNFCDRWCERCPEPTRDRCKVYQDELEDKLQTMANGMDPSDWDVVLESVKKNFDQTLSMVKSMAKKKNIDLDAVDDTAFKDQQTKERELYQHPLYKHALSYGKRVNQFLRETLYHKEEDPAVAGDYETLTWYYTLMPAKVHRFLCGLFAKDPMPDPEDAELDFNLCDAVAQMEICLKAVRQSKKALQSIFTVKMEYRYVIAELLEALDYLGGEIQKNLTDIEDGLF